MRRRPLNKTWVVDAGEFWETKAKTGQYKLQQHDGSDSIWDYKFRIIETRELLPSRIVATSTTPEEIGQDWAHFTGNKWRP